VSAQVDTKCIGSRGTCLTQQEEKIIFTNGMTTLLHSLETKEKTVHSISLYWHYSEYSHSLESEECSAFPTVVERSHPIPNKKQIIP
jgi:hypothetical protein